LSQVKYVSHHIYNLVSYNTMINVHNKHVFKNACFYTSIINEVYILWRVEASLSIITYNKVVTVVV
jgi:hypothetical protein